MSQSALDAVRELYEAFGRADVPAILSRLDQNIAWRVPENVPQGGDYQGRDDVGRFFEVVGESWDGLQIEIDDMVSSGDRVLVVLRASGKLRATGEDSAYGAVHAWTLRDGMPVRFEEYVDAPLGLPSARTAGQAA